MCVREANQIVTRQNERERMYAGYGATESDERLKTVSDYTTSIVYGDHLYCLCDLQKIFVIGADVYERLVDGSSSACV